MNLSLEELTRLVPPPVNPVASGSPGDWPQVEKELGVRLPQDFKDYIALYGAGQWADFFGIMNPFYEWKHPEAQESWSEWMQQRIGALESLRSEFPDDIAPFQPHPAPAGLLAFGYDENGGTLCWQTSGQPDSWAIVYLDEGLSKEYEVFNMSLTAFLAALLSRKINPRTFPQDFFPIGQPAFRPYTTE